MPEPTQAEALQCGAAALEVELSGQQVELLVGYQHLLQRWNEKFNLISRKDVGRLLARHLLDSLSISKWLHGERILDFGSGAGLPGIPLALVNADRQFQLVDRSARKVRFLEQVVVTLELHNVTVQCADAAALSGLPGFDTIVCRGVAGVEGMWQASAPLLGDGGRLVFMHRTNSTNNTESADLSQDRPDLPAGLRVARRQVQIPGLPTVHEVLIIEAAS